MSMSRKNTCPVLSLSPRAVSCFQARWRRGVCDLGAFGRHLVSGQRHFLRIAPTEFHRPLSAPNGGPQRGHGQTQRSAAAARAEIEAQKRKDECSDSRGVRRLVPSQRTGTPSLHGGPAHSQRLSPAPHECERLLRPLLAPTS
jgi:hypothetical protein